MLYGDYQQVRCVQFQDVSDILIVSILARGRASIVPTNVQCRRRAAYEAAAQLRMFSTCADTCRTPADGGTRLDESGRLVLAQPVWRLSTTIARIGERENVLGGKDVDYWGIIYDSQYSPNSVYAQGFSRFL
jgi:hypothetical protein